MSDDQVCVLEHRDDSDRPRRAWIGYWCRGHLDGLYRTLDDLSEFAGRADEASYDETVSVGYSQPTTGTKHQPLPVNEARIDHVRQVRGVMASWCQLISEERGVAVPDSPEPRITSGFLRLHLEFAAQQEWADEFANEIGELGRRAWSLLNPSGVRRIEIGPCREPRDHGDGQLRPCGGSLTALVRKTDDVLPSSIECAVCGVEITADKWLTYGRQVRGEAA